MSLINEHYLKLPGSYLFAEIARRVNTFKQANPSADIIRLGIGDVTQPLAPAVISALHAAVDEMAESSTFRGYGPEQGYEFIQQAILDTDFKPRGITLETSEIFVSDGSKSDVGNIQEIFGLNNIVAITDPVYPVYLDSNVMAGRTGALSHQHFGNIVYLPCTAENGFVPELPQTKADLIYLCLPNNPTGTTLTKNQLTEWVEYAQKNKAVILFDAAYEKFITQPDIPHSIYEIDGAQEVAIEFRSFSKTAGFTGTRCAYTVVPKALRGYTADGAAHSLNALWNRRQTTKFNGVPYMIQRGAAAIFTPVGQEQIQKTIAYYMKNASTILAGLQAVGLTAFGGVNAPYIWLKTPQGMDSWHFFDKLLQEAHIVGTPGAGFGPSGEGYFRLTAFGTHQNSAAAMERVKALKL